MVYYYLDTCIWRDYLEDRKDKFRPLGEWAFRLIRKIIDNEDEIIISNLLMDELKKDYSDKKINELFSIVPKELLININCTYNQMKEAKKITKILKIPFGDVLHAVLAKDKCAEFISRDNHFDKVDFIITKKPEELI